MMESKLIERLVKYAKIDTQSEESSETSPSTDIQKVLGQKLYDELINLGLQEVYYMDNGYVYGKLEGKIKGAKAVGFVAHIDTAPGVPASGVKPRIHEDYQGGDISLEDGVSITAADLQNHIGDTIITSDGTTLLGADDKAGISVIMTALETIKNTWDDQHGDIYVMFNPDEEIGRGTNNFDPEKFPVYGAYTMDGGKTGEIECETFNAAKATVKFKGKPTHPGQNGYQKLINPVSIACEYANAIPATERPETTRERFGFFYAYNITGTPEEASLDILIRDFDMTQLERKKEFLTKMAEMQNLTYGDDTVTIEIRDQYPNMKEALDQNYKVFEIAVEAMKEAGVEPKHPVIRGGTDGATLTVNHGIPTPNVSTGMYNIHSVKEFASVRDMVTATNFVMNVAKAYSKFDK